ncbi:hypothetical protein JOD07_003024 [Defluviitalea raffinosedens]|nr:hypothetical protein [Defluviitalea raffinosedens]
MADPVSFRGRQYSLDGRRECVLLRLHVSNGCIVLSLEFLLQGFFTVCVMNL